MSTHRDTDSGFHRAILGFVIQRRNASRALRALDSRFNGAGPILRPTGVDGHIDVCANKTEPNAARSNSSQNHDDHAHRIFGDVLLVPSRPRPVLGGKQYALNCATMAH